MTGQRPNTAARRNQAARDIAERLRQGETQASIARARGCTPQNINWHLHHGCPLQDTTSDVSTYHDRKRGQRTAARHCYECGRDESDGYRCHDCRERLNARRRAQRATSQVQLVDERTLFNERCNISERLLREKYDSAEIDAVMAVFKRIAAVSPKLRTELARQPHPYRWAFETTKTIMATDATTVGYVPETFDDILDRRQHLREAQDG